MNPETELLFRDSRVLADAFSEFICASAVLEGSYRSLQTEVARLSIELSERNASLGATLAENERIRGTLQQLIDSLPCGVLVLDDRQTIVIINPAARRLLKLEGSGIRLPEDIRRLSGVDLQAQAHLIESGIEVEIPMAANGGKGWLGFSKQDILGSAAQSELGSGQSNLRSIWIIRDITSSKQAEMDRERARNAVALAEIAAILAHEIRNPLASMELFAGLLLEQPEQGPEWVSNLLAGIRLLSGTVSNVLNTHSGAAPGLAAVDLRACIGSALHFVGPIAKLADIELCLTEQPDALQIWGNEEAIHQIILNLVSNSIRYTPPGGTIDISTKLVARAGVRLAVFEVKDSGCGIAPELLGEIFEAGVSGDGATPGLGLAVCKRLMTQMGGQIYVNSRISQGTTFVMEFPTL